MNDHANSTKSGIDPLVKRDSNRYKAFLISFIVFVASFVTFIVVAPAENSAQPNTISIFIFVIVFLSGLSFNISLWLCAKSTESSAIIWVGLNILFGPFSTIIIVFMMRSKMLKTISDLKAIRSSYA